MFCLWPLKTEFIWIVSTTYTDQSLKSVYGMLTRGLWATMKHQVLDFFAAEQNALDGFVSYQKAVGNVDLFDGFRDILGNEWKNTIVGNLQSYTFVI